MLGIRGDLRVPYEGGKCRHRIHNSKKEDDWKQLKRIE